MKFKQLAEYFEKLEKTPSRLTMTRILAEVLHKANADEAGKIVYLALGTLAPSYEGVVFNLAERLMLQVVAEAYGKELTQVKSLYRSAGDLGRVAYKLRIESEKVKIKNLSVLEVYERLRKMAEDAGEGSQERKVKATARLLSELDPLSARFVTRIPVGKLRLGFSDKTILDALSWMRRGDKSGKVEVERAYNVLPDVGLLVKRVKQVGIKQATKDPRPQVGAPVQPMLAQRLKSPKEMIEKMKRVAVEPKLDGLRLSVHYRRGKKGLIKAYTRNLNDTGWMFPELTKLGSYLRAKSVILDVEVVGVDPKRKAIANFQSTMTRRRKHAIAETAKKVPVKFYVFDVLLKDGRSLMGENYMVRRGVLEGMVKKGGMLELVDSSVTEEPDVIAQLQKKYSKAGFEGVIVKRVDGEYVPGRTGWRWVKMKEAENAVAKLIDTLDCVVMGYSAGKGKRVAFGLGQFLVGVRRGEKIVTVTKVGTGLTDKQFGKMNNRLAKLKVKAKPKEYEVHKNLEPHYWVEPKLVVEIAGDELTRSPKHTSGYALRFPRLVRFRDDKNVGQATSVKEIKGLV